MLSFHTLTLNQMLSMPKITHWFPKFQAGKRLFRNNLMKLNGKVIRLVMDDN